MKEIFNIRGDGKNHPLLDCFFSFFLSYYGGKELIYMYKELEVDFPIPYTIQKDIEEMLEYLNSGGEFPDVYMDNLRADLNAYKIDFEDYQVEMLKDYYCRGGIYCYGKVD